MPIYDVFNGDADGICALHQLRLARPCDSTLVTGIKRKIDLLKEVNAKQGDTITVLDISMDKNRDAVITNLENGASIVYFDHHFAGDIPEHENLQAFINTDANICTSLLVNQYLENAYLPWAVTATFGDNLFASAENAAKPLGLNESELEQLKLLGTCINYNGYGESLDDLVFHPDELYKQIQPYSNPFDFIEDADSYKQLESAYQEDIANVSQVTPEFTDDTHALYILDDKKWARRVSGVFANQLAQQHPSRAHAILSSQDNGGYKVSVRAPLENRTGADDLCRQFESGGGRKAAAGINHLPGSDFDQFLQSFKQAFN